MRVCMRMRVAIFLFVFTSLLQAGSSSQPKEFQKWPSGQSPQAIGKRVTERFLSTAYLLSQDQDKEQHIGYPESVTWYGALTFAKLSGDKGLSGRVVARFKPLLNEDAKLVPHPTHVDLTVFGAVPLEIYIQTKESAYLDLGRRLADEQWVNPIEYGLTNQTRFWIDDMYMITLVEVQAYRATGDFRYLDRAAIEMTAYLDKLQQPNGLFYHAPDAPFFWGRGNGWVAAGMTELLRTLPENHPRHMRIMEAYKKMMGTLLKYQGSDGMWRQLIDHPEAWPETSSTAMFTFAMITGVKNGWLDKKAYAPAARKGWLGLVGYIEPNGDIRNVCEGTGKNHNLQYYLDRKRNTGDLHGQAPIVWSAAALLR